MIQKKTLFYSKLDPKLDLVLNLFQAHSLEVLIQLNVFDEILLKTVKYEAEKNAILQNLAFSTFYPFKAFKIKQKYQLSPVVYYSQLITSAGYSMQTVRYLFGSNQNFMHIFLKKMELKLKLLNYDFLTISARLSER